ncbi:MAG: hypothetical protein HFI40_04305 [Lachnospiraceae bacterium]|jgi:inhibitor of cysteine peptidase|nr:hypothetical protein [Lachnospiraceae bacterium]
MKRKEKQNSWEEDIKAMLGKEREEMKLPDSLKPERIRQKILDYESEQERIGEKKTEKKRKKISWNIAIAAMAAVLILVVGGKTLFRQNVYSTHNLLGSKGEVAQDGETDSTVLESEESEADTTLADSSLADTEGTSMKKSEEVPAGIQKAADYEELLAIYKGTGLIVRQEEKKGSFWSWLKGDYRDGGEVIYDAGESIKGTEYDSVAGSADGAINEAGSTSNADVTMKPSESVVEAEADFSETNVQVEGVDEGDILKTDGTYIYRLSGEQGKIYIYQAEKETVTKVGSITLETDKSVWRGWTDLLLYQGRLAVVTTVVEYKEEAIIFNKEAEAGTSATDCYPGYGWGNTESRTELTVYDVSNPAEPKKIDTRVQEGEYQAIRMVDGMIYLVSYKTNSDRYFCDTKDETEYFKSCYVPQVDGEMVPCDRIYLPEKPQTPNCVIITSTDIRNPGQHLDTVAILGSATQLYMSNQNIYLWQTEYSWWTPYESNDETTTTIMKYSYQDGKMSAAGSATIKGYLNNSFSMDEYQGNLRVVTTCDVEGEQGTENQLYVLDEAMQVIGSIEDLAKGEYVKSARFFGDIGYFVTFRQTDPLFSVDLSEPAHPKIIGKLKIPGFSEYLHPYGKGLLLGIGQEADETSGGTEGVKLSMFDVSNPADVKEVAKCVVRDADYSNSDAEYNHRAILVSPDKNVIGFSIESGKSTDYEWKNSYEYCLFSYTEEEGFTERITHDFGEWENQYGSRGIYIGDYLYILYGYDRQKIAIYRLSDGTDYGVREFR